MKRLFIHIGTHKTGSTALQQTFLANNRLLSKYDYCFLSPDKTQHRNVKEIARENSKELNNEKNRLSKIIQKQSATNIILSSEGYFGNYMNAYSDINQIANNLRFVTQPYEARIMVLQHVKSSDTIRRLSTAEKAFSQILEKLRLKNIVRKSLIRLTSTIESH